MTIIACSRCPYPLRKYGAHKHESWELILQVTGSNRTKVGQEVYEMREGDVVVVPPGVSHEGISDGEFTDLFIKVDRMPFQGALHVSDQEGDIRTLMCMVHKITVQKEHNYRLIAEKLLETICEYLIKYAGQSYRYDFVIQLKNMIYSNLSNPDFQIGTAVKELGYTEDYVRKCFLKELGYAPQEYLTMLRMQQAGKLLVQESYMSIGNVALNCGYRDSFYFSRQFKKKFGETPRDYRQNRQ